MENQIDLDTLMDEILRVRVMKNKWESELSEIKEYLDELENDLVSKFSDLGVRAMTTKDGSNFMLVTTQIATIENWEELEKYVYENRLLDLMSRRVSSKAIKELAEAGEEVPGVGIISKVGLRVRK